MQSVLREPTHMRLRAHTLRHYRLSVITHSIPRPRQQQLQRSAAPRPAASGSATLSYIQPQCSSRVTAISERAHNHACTRTHQRKCLLQWPPAHMPGSQEDRATDQETNHHVEPTPCRAPCCWEPVCACLSCDRPMQCSRAKSLGRVSTSCLCLVARASGPALLDDRNHAHALKDKGRGEHTLHLHGRTFLCTTRM